MIIRSGLALTITIPFNSGAPTSAISWRLYDGLGVLLTSGTAAVTAGAVSHNLTVPGANNTLANGAQLSTRDLEWSYTVAGGVIVNGDQRYTVEARPPYGTTTDGVRRKLGVEPHDLPDDQISLTRAFVSFRDLVGASWFSGLTDEADILAVGDAIEAQAALDCIPTMQVRVAIQEDSGTDSFKRQAIDWTLVAESLSAYVNAGILTLNPAYDPSPTAELFVLATPSSDPFTGDAYS